MLRPYVGEMTEQRTFEPLRQHRNTIAIALAAAYCDFILRKIDVLHAQSQCLEQAHARSIQHTRHECRRPSALSRASTRRTSSLVRTTGTRVDRFARTNADSQPTGMS